MGKGTLIRPSRVEPYVFSDAYTSYMLLDHTNSEAKNIHINKGVLKPGAALLPASKHGEPGQDEYNETYIILKGSCRFELDGEELFLEPGDIVFIPAGVYHGLDNREGTDDLELLTIWPKVPGEGINPVYDMRLKEWGKSFAVK
jgi:quercetin dioxygenase-like cupin family protein